MEYMKERRKLTDDEMGDAKRLDNLLKKAKSIDKSFTRDSLGQKFGWSSSGLVSQYAKGYIPLNVKVAVQFYGALKETIKDLKMDDLSPRFATMVEPVSISSDPFSGDDGVVAAYKQLSPDRQRMVEEHIKSLYFRQKSEEQGVVFKGLLSDD